MVWQFVALIIRVFSTNLNVFNPPNPVKSFFYKCDKYFHLDLILLLYAETKSYGIILASGSTTMYWSYATNNTKLLKTIKADLPNKHKTGGQSAQRFERIRDEKINMYVKKI